MAPTRRGLVFPGYKYLGPGNSLNKGAPNNLDDQIAYDHDVEYDRAQSDSDVRAADWKAIQRFGKSASQGGLGGILGTVGLGSKYAIESLTGVLYPKTGNYEEELRRT